VAGIFASERKEILLKDIEVQIVMGEVGLKEEDRWLLEVELSDLACDTAGEKEAYWVMAITTAKEHFHLNQNIQSCRWRRDGSYLREYMVISHLPWPLKYNFNSACVIHAQKESTAPSPVVPTATLCNSSMAS
jgi:hypothetical protein